MEEHVFHRFAEILFFCQEWRAVEITLQFHKNYQNIFQNDAIFYQI